MWSSRRAPGTSSTSGRPGGSWLRRCNGNGCLCPIIAHHAGNDPRGLGRGVRRDEGGRQAWCSYAGFFRRGSARSWRRRRSCPPAHRRLLTRGARGLGVVTRYQVIAVGRYGTEDWHSVRVRFRFDDGTEAEFIQAATATRSGSSQSGTRCPSASIRGTTPRWSLTFLSWKRGSSRRPPPPMPPASGPTMKPDSYQFSVHRIGGSMSVRVGCGSGGTGSFAAAPCSSLRRAAMARHAL